MKSPSFSLPLKLTLAAWILAGLALAAQAQVKIDGVDHGSPYSITSGTQTSNSYTQIGDGSLASPSSGTLNILSGGKFVTNASMDISFGGVYVDGPASSLVTNGYVGIGNNTSLWGGLVNLNHGALFHAASTTENLDIGSQAGVSGSLYVAGGSLLNAEGNVSVGVQLGANGLLQVDGAGQATLAKGLTVGWQGTGNVLINGPGSKLTANGYSSIGDMGSGNMTLSNSANFTAGDIVVLGLNATGAGSVAINSGATVSVAKDVQVGWQGTGELTVDGAGSQLNLTGQMTVGHTGAGTLTLSNSGATSVGGHLVLGNLSSGTGVMSLAGASTLANVTGDFTAVGYFGTGTLNVGPGASFQQSNGLLTVASETGSTGTLNVTSGGMMSLKDFIIGGHGAAAANVNSGGLVTANGYFAVGYDAPSNGTLSISGPGSHMSALGDAHIGVQGVGNLVVADGGIYSVNGWSGVGLQGTGNIHVSSGGTMTTAGDLVLGQQTSGTGSLTLDSSTSMATIGGGFEVGQQGTGTVSLSDGATLNTTGWGTIVGHEAGSSGAVTIDGAGSTWNNSGDLLVGWAGTGSFAVSNGGTLSTHVLTLGGDFSTGVGKGTLSISNGGTVNSFDGLLGNSPGSTGTVTVEGAGSAWHISSDLEVGVGLTGIGTGANGIIHITNGGTVTAGWFMGIGDNGNAGTVTVDGAGSQLSVAGGVALAGGSGPGTGELVVANGGLVSISEDLQVGTVGHGDLAITGGGNLSSGISAGGYTTSIGTMAGSSGAVTVDGAGSTWTTSDHLLVGEAGAGSLAITHGGAVSASSVIVATNVGSTGTVTVDGGTLNTAALTINSGGTLNYNSSSLTAGAINSSTLTNSGQFTINTRNPIAGSADVRTLGATVANLAAGRIDVNLANDASVTFTGPVTNDGLFKVTQLAGTSGGVTTFTDTFTNTGTFISDPTTTHFADLFNFGQFTAGPGDTIIVDHGFVNNGMVDIFGGAEFYGDYSGPGSLQFHISSATDRLFFSSGFTGSLELIFDPGYLFSGTENFLYFGQGAYLTELLIGGVSYGSAGYAGAGYLSGNGTFVPASSVPDTAGTLGLLGVSLLALAAVRRRVA